MNARLLKVVSRAVLTGLCLGFVCSCLQAMLLGAYYSAAAPIQTSEEEPIPSPITGPKIDNVPMLPRVTKATRWYVTVEKYRKYAIAPSDTWPDVVVERCWFGWPARSMEYVDFSQPPTTLRSPPARTTNGLPWPIALTRWGREFKVPTHIIWSGAAINTMLMGLACVLSCVIGGVLRRRWRRARGECGRCRYPLRSLPKSGGETVCPECGGW